LRGEKAIHNPRCRHDSDQRETPRSRMQNAFCHVGLRSVLPCWYRPVVRFLSASRAPARCSANAARDVNVISVWEARSEEHTAELQSIMRNSYAVFCLKKK